MNCCGYNVSQILTGGEKMSSDTYKQERDRHFDEWWESDENDLLGLVDIDVAKEIWNVAYRFGGKQPWWSINQLQLKALMKGMK